MARKNDLIAGLSNPSFSIPIPSNGVNASVSASTPNTQATATTPDYQQLVQSDPIYQQQLAGLKQQSVTDAGTRKLATDQALINFGEIPDLSSTLTGLGLNPSSAVYQMLSSDIDPATQTAAQGMTNSGLSTTAQLQKAHTGALDALMSSLAARGVVRSGATDVGTNLENQNYLANQFGARNALLQALLGYQSAYTSAEQQRQNLLAGYLQDAVTRQMQINPTPPDPTPSGSLPPGATGSYIGDTIPTFDFRTGGTAGMTLLPDGGLAPGAPTTMSYRQPVSRGLQY